MFGNTEKHDSYAPAADDNELPVPVVLGLEPELLEVAASVQLRIRARGVERSSGSSKSKYQKVF